jgi:hypothetical protein
MLRLKIIGKFNLEHIRQFKSNMRMLMSKELVALLGAPNTEREKTVCGETL